MRKKRVLFVVGVLLCFGIIGLIQPFTSHYDEKKEGSITIQLTDTKQNYSKTNVKFGLEKIAEAVNGKFILNQQYQDTLVNINDVKTKQKMINATLKIKSFIIQPSNVVSTDKTGKARVEHLPSGVYLGYVLEEGEYEPILPFLVTLSSIKQDVTVLPKHEEFPVFRCSKIDTVTHHLIQDNRFEYTLYADKNCTEKIVSISNKDYVEIKIPYGIGFIRESQSPQGYLKSEEIIKVEFNLDGFFVNDGHVDLDGKAFSSFVFGNCPINANES